MTNAQNIAVRLGLVVASSALVLTACTMGNDRGSQDRAEAPRHAPPPPPPPPSTPTAEVVAAPSIFLGTTRMGQAKQSRYPGPHILPHPPVIRKGQERYAKIADNPVKRTAQTPVSTFSIDVDTGAYANVRRMLTHGSLPPRNAVRVEEMINYFDYGYARPATRARPFAVHVDAAKTPWNSHTQLVRIGLQGYDVERSARPAANLVFLVDVSGSMRQPEKLPLVQSTLRLLAKQLRSDDRVSIVVYAGAARVVLEPTADTAKIRAAIDGLRAGGSTAGGDGIRLAYGQAKSAFIKAGINRVIMATDGDFNVGITGDEPLQTLVKAGRDQGITLTTLGFGTGNYNEAMMESVADVGNGNYAYIDSLTEAKKVLKDELSSTLFTIAQDVKIQVEFNPAVVAEYRLVGYENRLLREEDFNNDMVDAGDIGAGHNVTALYEVALIGSPGILMPERRYPANRVKAADGPANELAYLKLRYKLPGAKKSKLIARAIPTALVRSARPAHGNFALAAAVSAFGQKLRGGQYLGDMRYQDIAALIGNAKGYYAGELRQLTELAAGLSDEDKRPEAE